MGERSGRNPHNGPMSVYEVHLGSWRQGHRYRDLAEHLVNYVTDLGFTHVELHAGHGAPVRPVVGLPRHRLLRPDLAVRLPRRLPLPRRPLHRHGIGVILDWVPGHFATDAVGAGALRRRAAYEHPDPPGWHQPEWGSHIFDFGRHEVRNFLVANALYWLEEFHIDGLRVDGVASMLYLDYSRKDGEWMPNIRRPREPRGDVSSSRRPTPPSTSACPASSRSPRSRPPGRGHQGDRPGGLGFGFKWNMGWMHDTLRYLGRSRSTGSTTTTS